MRSTPTAKWIVDAALLLGYCVAVWLDLTGLELHQWLGVGVVLLAGYHLLTHMDWVAAVSRRLFGKTSPRARLYYLINVLMLGGFITIGATGLLISTWLNLSMSGLAALTTIHEWSAYLTLAVIVVKLALHWRWIVNVAGKFFKAPAARRAPAGAPAPGLPARGYSRRESLKLMGAAALSTAAMLGVTAKTLEALKALDGGSAEASAALANTTTPSATSAPVSVVLPTATTAAATALPTATTAAATALPTATTAAATALPTATTAAATACVSCRRHKHCSYPGDCRDYVDTNGNNRCDLGECA